MLRMNCECECMQLVVGLWELFSGKDSKNRLGQPVHAQSLWTVLVDYKQYMSAIHRGGEQLSEEAQQKTADKFEQSLGTVLKNAWFHVEALQTTDLPLLIDYIGLVLRDATDSGQGKRWPEQLESFEQFGTRQEAMVLHYLHGKSTAALRCA